MSIIRMSAAAARTRTLSVQRSPFVPSTDAWGTRVTVHNYIRPFRAEVAVRDELGSKQAAPPRGVPR